MEEVDGVYCSLCDKYHGRALTHSEIGSKPICLFAHFHPSIHPLLDLLDKDTVSNVVSIDNICGSLCSMKGLEYVC